MPQENSVWKPQIEKRPHPVGEKGVRLSLEAVAKKSAEGSTDPRVRAWAIEQLERVRRGGQTVKTPSTRARILLSAVQKKLWVPDPVGTEWMAGAHLMACVDKDAPCFHGSDCDDLCILLAASLLSVGIYTMIVGHAYDSQQRIEHVLCAAHLDGRWQYADPSTDLPLGKCVPFSRERLLSVPNVQVLCDDRSCLRTQDFDPDKMNFVDKGLFVGVDGPPTSLLGLAAPIAWITEDDSMLGQVAPQPVAEVRLINLKDRDTMADVKRMMAMVDQTYRSTTPWWSPNDWDKYSALYDKVSKSLAVTKAGGVAYQQPDGTVVQTNMPPAGTLGFPSFVGIQNMGDYLVKIKTITKDQVKTLFPKLASYGMNVAGVTAPVFGPSEKAGAGATVSGGSSVLPWILGAIVIGGVGLVVASRD